MCVPSDIFTIGVTLTHTTTFREAFLCTRQCADLSFCLDSPVHSDRLAPDFRNVRQPAQPAQPAQRQCTYSPILETRTHGTDFKLRAPSSGSGFQVASEMPARRGVPSGQHEGGFDSTGREATTHPTEREPHTRASNDGDLRPAGPRAAQRGSQCAEQPLKAAAESHLPAQTHDSYLRRPTTPGCVLSTGIFAPPPVSGALCHRDRIYQNTTGKGIWEPVS